MKSFLLFNSILLPLFSFDSSSVTANPLSVTETAESNVWQEAGTQTNTYEGPSVLDDVTPIERPREVKGSLGEKVEREVQQHSSSSSQLKSASDSVALLKSVIYFAVVFIVTLAFHMTMIEPKLMAIDPAEGKLNAADEDDVEKLFRAKHPFLTSISFIALLLTVATFINMYYRMFKALIQMLIDSFTSPGPRSLAD
ncbi:hypothetical protein ACSSS7_000168 [Eimeria intestinalis]